MHHRYGSISTYGLNSQRQGDEHPRQYQDFSLPGIFAPQWEPSLPGMKVPGNEELSFLV